MKGNKNLATATILSLSTRRCSSYHRILANPSSFNKIQSALPSLCSSTIAQQSWHQMATHPCLIQPIEGISSPLALPSPKSLCCLDESLHPPSPLRPCRRRQPLSLLFDPVSLLDYLESKFLRAGICNYDESMEREGSDGSFVTFHNNIFPVLVENSSVLVLILYRGRWLIFSVGVEGGSADGRNLSIGDHLFLR